MKKRNLYLKKKLCPIKKFNYEIDFQFQEYIRNNFLFFFI